MSTLFKNTVSSLKPVLELLKGDLLSPDPKDTALTTNMCRVLSEKYSPFEIQNLLTKATILDPRYRGTMEDAEVLDDVKAKLLQELLDMNSDEEKKGPVVRSVLKLQRETKDLNLNLQQPRRKGCVTLSRTEEPNLQITRLKH